MGKNIKIIVSVFAVALMIVPIFTYIIDFTVSGAIPGLVQAFGGDSGGAGGSGGSDGGAGGSGRGGGKDGGFGGGSGNTGGSGGSDGGAGGSGRGGGKDGGFGGGSGNTGGSGGNDGAASGGGGGGFGGGSQNPGGSGGEDGGGCCDGSNKGGDTGSSGFGGDSGNEGGSGGEDGGGCCDGPDRDGGGGDDKGGRDPIDVCPNLSGVQTSVPNGRILFQGQCVIDMCPNLSGVQIEIPNGRVLFEGNCVIDQCPNLSGVQVEIPDGRVKNSSGNCVIPPQDICPNLSGVQTEVPTGMVLFNGECVIDQCPNLNGVQLQVPPGRVKDSNGNCVTPSSQCVPPAFQNNSVQLSATVGSPFNHTVLIATGTRPVSLSAQNLPPGLSFSTSTGIISGTPTQSGNFTINITAQNQCGSPTATVILNIGAVQCITPAPVITSSLSASATVGNSFSYTLTTTGVVTILQAQNLPAGLSFNPQTGVISGTPTQSGTSNIILRASNACGSVAQTLVLTVTGGGGGSCPISVPTITSTLSLSSTVNQPLSYTIGFSGTVNTVEVTNLPSFFNFSTTSNVIFGTPTTTGAFQLTIRVSNQCGFDQETLNISVISAPVNSGGGGGGGGGGFFAPTVTLTRATTSSPLAAFTSVYLSQVPYTGLNDTLIVFMFFVGIFAVSFGIAYLFLYKKPLKILSLRMRKGEDKKSSLNEEIKEETLNDPYKEVKTFSSYNVSEEIKNSLELVRKSIEDEAKTTSSKEISEESIQETETSFLEEIAKREEAHLPIESAKLILSASDNSKEVAKKILNQVIGVYKSENPIPRDSYTLLQPEKVKSILFSTYVSMVPLFIRWLADKDEVKVMNFIRMINSQGHSVSDLIKSVAFELDRVYRFRMEREAGADEYSIESTMSWNNKTLEKIISILVQSFDGSYTSSSMSGKLALSKVFDVVGEGKLLIQNNHLTRV